MPELDINFLGLESNIKPNEIFSFSFSESAHMATAMLDCRVQVAVSLH
jgi:hypothetical protein